MEDDAWVGRFVPEGEPSDVKVIVAEFATAKQAAEAFGDLGRWSEKKNRLDSARGG